MAEEKKGLEDLKELAEATAETDAPTGPETEKDAATSEDQVEPALDEQGRSYATGKRKNAVARVWLRPGAGRIIVNGRDQEKYFARPTLRLIVNQPFDVTKRSEAYDVTCTVKGGGLSGQAGAVKHGISKALCNYEPDLRQTLKAAGFLTRDARVVERKKYGRRKARRSYQFSKR